MHRAKPAQYSHMHLLIPFASTSSDACALSFSTLKLPHFRRLMQRMKLQNSDAGDEYTQSPPHERALAACYGLSVADGCIPWAALDLAQNLRHSYASGQAWAHVTPCYWRVGVDNITLPDPSSLQLSEADAQAVFAAMQPYFAEDGITLYYDSCALWFAHSPLFEALPTASLDRVIGRNINPWMPEAVQAAPLRRLYNEMQMLLYTHPVNDARQAAGLPPVNAFWVSGTGSLAAAPQASDVQVINTLRTPALNEDWAAWAAAWQAIDHTQMQQAIQHLDAGGALELTLCGERNALRYSGFQPSLFNQFTSIFRPMPAPNMREQL